MKLVPVRGYEKGCSPENVEFAGIAAVCGRAVGWSRNHLPKPA